MSKFLKLFSQGADTDVGEKVTGVGLHILLIEEVKTPE